METMWKSRKVVIVGAGAVGSSFAYALAQKGLADEICLVDANNDLAAGQVLDLAHGLPYYPPVQISVGNKKDYADASVIVITAGAKQKPDELRLNLLQRNASIIKSIVDDIVSENSQGIIVLTSNPVDILTHVALKHSGWTNTVLSGQAPFWTAPASATSSANIATWMWATSTPISWVNMETANSLHGR